MLRDLYNRLERAVTPVANQFTRSDEAADAAMLLAKITTSLRRQANGLAARAWHAVNLPASTDVERLRAQLGSLDREVRLLALELERSRKEAQRRGDSRPQHD